MNWLKKAFEIERGEPQPTDAQKEVVDKLCRFVARRRLTTPALAFLEMSKPLNYISSQAMHFFMPMVRIITDARGFEAFAEFLEHRGSVEYMCRRLEAIEEEFTRRERGESAPPTESGDDSDDAPL